MYSFKEMFSLRVYLYICNKCWSFFFLCFHGLDRSLFLDLVSVIECRELDSYEIFPKALICKDDKDMCVRKKDSLKELYSLTNMIYMVGKSWISASIWHWAIEIWSILQAIRISGTHTDRLLNSSWHCVLNDALQCTVENILTISWLPHVQM